jgi:hypothetical protein
MFTHQLLREHKYYLNGNKHLEFKSTIFRLDITG